MISKIILLIGSAIIVANEWMQPSPDIVVLMIMVGVVAYVAIDTLPSSMQQRLARFPVILTLEIVSKFIDAIAYIIGYRVYIAKSAQDLHQVYALRYAVYLEKGYVKPNTEGLFFDKYDTFSENIVVKKRGNGIISALRLVYANDKVGMPQENYFNILGQKAEVEFAKWVTLPEYRAKKFQSRIVTILVGIKSYILLLKKGIKWGIIGTYPKLQYYIEKVFYIQTEFANLGQPLEYHIKNRVELSHYFSKESDIVVLFIPINLRYIFSFISATIKSEINRKLNVNFSNR